jgi:hypothetical protein
MRGREEHRGRSQRCGLEQRELRVEGQSLTQTMFPDLRRGRAAKKRTEFSSTRLVSLRSSRLTRHRTIQVPLRSQRRHLRLREAIKRKEKEGRTSKRYSRRQGSRQIKRTHEGVNLGISDSLREETGSDEEEDAGGNDEEGVKSESGSSSVDGPSDEGSGKQPNDDRKGCSLGGLRDRDLDGIEERNDWLSVLRRARVENEKTCLENSPRRRR